MNWKTTSRNLALLAAVIGALGFAGWVFEIDALKRIHPAWVTMKANTGLCLILAGFAVALLHEENADAFRRRVAQVCAALIFAVGLLTLGEHLGWWATGIDQALFPESLAAAGRSFPGRMNPPSTLNFMLLGLAVLLLDVRPRFGVWPAQICAFAVIVVTFLIFLIYFYNVEIPEGLKIYLSIALHTVLAFKLLAVALLLARPDRGIMAVFLAENMAGVIARRMLPATLVLPAFIGWLCTLGRNAGYYGRGVGTALLATAVTVIFTGLVWWAARALADSDARRHAAEGDLLRSERELSDFFENAAVALHWVGPDGKVLRANDAELAMLGYARTEYVGRSIADFHADPPVIADILARLSAGETLADYPARLRCKDGSLREVLIHSSVYWEDGKFIHTRCFTRDITERNRADAELAQARDAAEAANRAKDDFLAVLSHELRTPLTPALAAVSELEAAPPHDPAELRATLALIRRNVELEARLVDDLLDLTRISAGKLRIAAVPVDLHVILHDALAIAEPLLRKKNIAVESRLTAPRHLVRGDAARLTQVFSNVLTNAAKFTPPEGRVTLRTANPGEGEVGVEVGDSGIGIAPEMLPKIFEPFRQEEASTTRRFGGLGLGLSVAKNLVEAHGGTIRAHSGGRDQGATFAITLPALEATALAGESPTASAAPSAPGRTLHVLLVEDHEDTRHIFQRLIARAGHRVTAASSVAQARETLAAETFDLLLTDLGLSDGSGLEVIAALRERSDIPAVAMSGYGMKADLARSQAAGFAEHLVKPVTAETLRALLIRYAAPTAPPAGPAVPG